MRKNKTRILFSLFIVMALSFSFVLLQTVFAETVTIDSHFSSHYGEFENALDTEGNVTGVKAKSINAVMGCAVSTINSEGAYGKYFNLNYKAEIPSSGNYGFLIRANTNTNGIISVYETATVYIRVQNGSAYIISNGAILAGAAWYGDNIPAIGDEVDVEVKIFYDEATEKDKVTFVVKNNDVECMWLGGNIETTTYSDSNQFFCLATDGLTDGVISNIKIQNTETNTITKIYCPIEVNYTTTLHSDFNVNSGTWKQTLDSDVTKITELKADTLSTTADATLNSALLIGKFGKLIGNDFNISYQQAIPVSGGTAGFYYRAKHSGATSLISIYESTGVYLRFDLGCMYVISTAFSPLQIAYTNSVEANEIVNVSLNVTGTTVDIDVKKADNTIVVDTTVNNLPAYESGTMAGFISERFLGTFKNVTVTASEKTYVAYPFEVIEIEEPDPNSGFSETELAKTLNPNFSLMCGSVMEATDSSRLEVTAVHTVYGTAGVISTFGGVYGNSFDLSFDTATPTAAEASAYEASSTGFLFRATDPTNVYSGIYVRIQDFAAFVIVPNKDGTSKMFGFVFDTKPDAGALVTVNIIVSGNNATVSFYDINKNKMPFKYNGLGTSIEEYTVTSLPEYASENQYSGFASDQMMGKYKNIVMTSGEKSFIAYPFAEGKENLSQNYIISGTGTNDKTVQADVESEGFLKADWDIISDGFPYIIYTDYNGLAHDLIVTDLQGNVVSSDYIVTINFKRPPYTTMNIWSPQTNAERHGIYVTIADSDGYVYANIKCALRICAIEISIEDVVAVNRAYDTTRIVQLTGGKLVGVTEGVNIGFTLGEGSLTNASPADKKAVTAYIVLTGTDATNYTLIQPTLTVNISKGVMEAPDKLTLLSDIDGTVTFTEPDEMEYMEFCLDNGEWQSSVIFTNVPSGTHKFYARYKEDNLYNASTASEIEITVKGAKVATGCSGSSNAMVLIIAMMFSAVIFLRKK